MTGRSAEKDARANRLEWAARGLCVHAHCLLDGPHWHGGIWRSGHMREHTILPEKVVPPCPKCGKPLGLYYMDCLWCYGHAGDFSYADYERVNPPERTGE